MASSPHALDVLITIGDGVGNKEAAAAAAASGGGVGGGGGGGMDPASPRGEVAPRPIDETERLLSLQIAIKVCPYVCV